MLKKGEVINLHGMYIESVTSANTLVIMAIGVVEFSREGYKIR